MPAFDVRLVAHAAAGDRLGVLPDPLELSASFPHNDVGALSVTYSRLALGGDLLDRALSSGLELAVEVTDHTGAWVEPAGARFVWVASTQDVADQARTVKIAAPSYGWLLSKARLLDLSNLLPEDHTQAGKRPFYSASAGTIVRTLMQENAQRGGVPVTLGFTSTTDAAGKPWSLVSTLYYEPGIDVASVLDNLTAQGMCDWRTIGRDLRLWNADAALAADRSTAVRLHLGRDITEAPSEESLEEVIGRALLRGDNGLTLTIDNPAAPTPWGIWEGYLSQGGVADESTARQLVQAELDRRSRTRAQYTRGLVLAGAQRWPLVDYRPGEWITGPTSVPAERVRVAQVTLTRGADGVGGSVVLNDRVLDAELRRAKRMVGITGGSQTDGGSGARPAPEGPDKRTPAAPKALVVDSDAYIDTDGAARGVLSLDWADVATATDGTAMEIVGYDVAVRENVVGAPWGVVRSVEESEATHGPVQVGAVLQVKVRAKGRYSTTPGAWSGPVTVTVADDVTPPPVPSVLTVTVDRAVVRAAWDGKTVDGAKMPIDFARVEVEQEGHAGTVAGTILDVIGGSAFITDLPYGEPVRYRARAVDRSGNASVWSGWSKPVTPTPLVKDDIDERITGAIEANRADFEALAPALAQNQADVAQTKARVDMIEPQVTAALEGNAESMELARAAKGDAGAAKTAAADAQSTADTARSAATTAQSTADAAKTSAATAAGIAGGKADVLIQSATPATSYRVATTLWIDTTGGANTPKRWSGSAWVAVTDKAATDAAGAAATAQSAAVAAQKSADAAQAKADAAADAATAAGLAADKAQTSADGKSRVSYGTSAPTSTTPGRPGDTYWVVSGSSIPTMYRCTAGTDKATGNTWVSATFSGALLTDATIATGKILDDAIVAAKIATNAVTMDAIASSAVGTAQLASLAVTQAKIAALAVGTAQIADAAIVQAKIGALAVGTAQIADGAIVTAKIGTAQITNALIADATITSAKIAALDAGKITTGYLAAARIAAASITAAKLAAGTITAASGVIANAAIGTALIADAAVTSAKIASLEAGKIVAGSLAVNTAVAQAFWAAKITTQKILASEVVIGAGGNLHPDAAMAMPTLWDNSAWITAGNGTDGATGLVIPAGTTQTGSYFGAADYAQYGVPVTAGQRLRVSAWVCSPVALAANVARVWVRVVRLDTGATTNIAVPSAAIPAATWTRIEGIATVPTTMGDNLVAVFGLFKTGTTTGVVRFSMPEVRSMVDASLVVDGSILARHVKAGAIEALHIAANAIDADKIAVGALDGYVITGALIRTAVSGARVELSSSTLRAYNSSGTVTAEIAGGTATFTGATFRTASSGARVQMTTAGISAYNASGTRTVFIDAADGSADLTGTLRTSSDLANAAELTGSLYSGRPGLRLGIANSDGVQPQMFAMGAGGSGYGAGSLVVMGSETTVNSTGRTELEIRQRGGGFRLGQQYGARSGYGVELYASGQLDLRGYLAKGDGGDNLLTAYRATTSGMPAGSWSVSVTPSAVGARQYFFTPESASNAVTYAVKNMSAQGCNVIWAGADNGTFGANWLIVRVSSL